MCHCLQSFTAFFGKFLRSVLLCVCSKLIVCSQVRIGLVMTLVLDIALPFTTISILNAILISAIRNRNRNLESFCEGAVSNRSSAGKTITTERNNRKNDSFF